jgi:predicted RNA-binding Zn-ribbon protein involved in translation (DUF1610 family)
VGCQEKFLCECADCDFKFKPTNNKNDVFECPNCGSYDTEIVDIIRPDKIRYVRERY